MTQELKQRAREAIEQLAALDASKKPGGGVHGQVIGCEPWVIRTNGFGLNCLFEAQSLLNELLDPFDQRPAASPSPATDADEDRVKLFKELNWCIEEGNIGPRSKKAIIAARNFVASTRTASDTRTAAGEAECDAALGRAAPAGQHDADEAAHAWMVAHGYGNQSFGYALADLQSRIDAKDREGMVLARRWMGAEAELSAAFRSRAKGGNTCNEPGQLSASKPAETRMDAGFGGGQLVDVEAERPRFEEAYAADAMPCEADWFKREADGDYVHTNTEDAWRGWKLCLAARTQADAGKAEPQLLCSKCGADRLKQPCGSLSDCALIGIAQAVPLSGAATQIAEGE